MYGPANERVDGVYRLDVEKQDFVAVTAGELETIACAVAVGMWCPKPVESGKTIGDVQFDAVSMRMLRAVQKLLPDVTLLYFDIRPGHVGGACTCEASGARSDDADEHGDDGDLPTAAAVDGKCRCVKCCKKKCKKCSGNCRGAKKCTGSERASGGAAAKGPTAPSDEMRMRGHEAEFLRHVVQYHR